VEILSFLKLTKGEFIMMIFQSKISKLIKLAIKLINKLIYTIDKIQTTYNDAQEKLENLELSKVDLTQVVETLETLLTKLNGK
jgi:flagellar biosynthesis chaperone FliJ